MTRKLFICAALFGTLISVQAKEPSIATMLNEGQVVSVYRDPDFGLCVGAVGIADRSSSKARDLEIAKTNAIENLSGYLSGTRVIAQTKMHLESVNGKASDSFLSDVRTNVKAYLRAVEVVRSGTANGTRFAFARVCQNSANISDQLRGVLRDNTVRAVGIASLDLGREKARRMALDDAVRNAVTQYSGVTTTSSTTVQNATDLQSKMATRTKGIVSKYTVVTEEASQGVYRIEIVATVEEQKAETNPAVMAQAVRENMGRPSIYVDAKDQLAREIFEELLKKNHFDVTRKAKMARYIMTVNSTYEEEPVLEDMIGRRTTLNVSVKDRMSPDVAVQLSNDPAQSTEASDNIQIRARRSMQYAVDSIKDQLLGSLDGQTVDQFNNGSKVLIAFHRFGRLREAENMVKLLESFPLTKKVSLRPIESNIAYYEVIYLGDPSELQMMAVKAAPKYRLNGLKALNQNGSGLDFTF